MLFNKRPQTPEHLRVHRKKHIMDVGKTLMTKTNKELTERFKSMEEPFGVKTLASENLKELIYGNPLMLKG